jgi:hypothetical protein
MCASLRKVLASFPVPATLKQLAGLWIVLKASSDEILESFALAFLFGVDAVEVAFELLVCLVPHW